MRTLFLAPLAIVAMPAIARAETVTLDTSILPSAQGWTYISGSNFAGIPETAFFSNVGGELVQNTMGSGVTHGPGVQGNFYARRINFGAADTFSLTVVARIAQSEQFHFNGSPYDFAPYGFVFSVSTNPDYYLNSVSAEGRVLTTGDALNSIALPGAFDPLTYNTYRVTGGHGRMSLMFNGATVYSGIAPETLIAPHALVLGDGSGLANANVFVRSYEFTSTAVPEPASWALMIMGFGAVGSALRRRAPLRVPLSGIQGGGIIAP